MKGEGLKNVSDVICEWSLGARISRSMPTGRIIRTSTRTIVYSLSLDTPSKLYLEKEQALRNH